MTKPLMRWHRRLLQKALELTPIRSQELRVLEVGPGHGYFAHVCRSYGFDYEFVDISKVIFDKMTKQGFSGSCKSLASLTDLPKRYDLVWMSHVLEHSPTWIDARAMLSEGKKLLSEEGSLVIVSPDYLSSRKMFFDSDATHGYPTTLRNVVQLAQDTGFTNIDARFHRGAFFSGLGRMFSAFANLIPRQLDRILSPGRSKTGNGFIYSWKTVYGWRQIFIVLRK